MVILSRFCIMVFSLYSTAAFAQTYHDKDFSRSFFSYNDLREKSKKPMSLNIGFRQRGESFENSAESSFLYTISATPEFKLKLNKFMTFNSKVSVSSRIGSVQSRFGDLRARSAIIIRDTRLKFFNNYVKNDFFVDSFLSLGAIDQGVHHRYFDNFISKRALPGIEEKLVLARKDGAYSYGLSFQGFQGIPTAQSDTLDFTEKESTPTFVSADLEFFLKKERSRHNYRANAWIGLFQFDDLPAAIADESRLYGNSVDFVGAASEFQYDFAGWYGGWAIGYAFKRIYTSLQVQMLQNLEAPDRRNQAQVISWRTEYSASPKLKVSFVPFSFFTQSDASVASYNFLAGHNNREGYGARVKFNLIEKKFDISINYAHSDLIEESPNNLQLKQDYLGINLEYKNDFL